MVLDRSLSSEGLSYYKALNVEKTATKSEIKKAYHKSALRCHPDKHPNNEEAAEKFKQINKCNNILQDEQKRKVYDKMGSQGVAMAEQVGWESMDAIMKYDKWYYRVGCLLACVLTGCCFGCCCFCLCCCCCCGKCAPKPKEDEDEQAFAKMSSDEEITTSQPTAMDNQETNTQQQVFAMPPPTSSSTTAQQSVFAMPPPPTSSSNNATVFAMPAPETNTTNTDNTTTSPPPAYTETQQ